LDEARAETVRVFGAVREGEPQADEGVGVGRGLVEVGENQCRGTFELEFEGRDGSSESEKSSGSDEEESDKERTHAGGTEVGTVERDGFIL